MAEIYSPSSARTRASQRLQYHSTTLEDVDGGMVKQGGRSPLEQAKV